MTRTLEESNIYYHFTLIEGKIPIIKYFNGRLRAEKTLNKRERDKVAKFFEEL